MAKPRISAYLLLVLLVAFALWRTHGPRKRLFEAARPLLGTVVTIKVSASDDSTAQTLIRHAFEEIERIDQAMSSHSLTSELARVNSGAGKGWIFVSPDLMTVLKRSQHFSRLSGGAFDVTIGPVERLWGFGTEDPHIPSAAQLTSRLALVGYEKLQISEGRVLLTRPGMELDLGGIAKGYAVDRAIAILKKGGAEGALVDAGGDIRFFGVKPDGKNWRIAVRHPREKGRLIRVGDIGLSSVATSGDYERFFIKDGKRYHHILDPKTGYPAEGCVSVTIWAETAMDADILSTAVFVMGPDEGMGLIERLDRVEGLIFFQEGRKLKCRASRGVRT